jgi:ankyrin repeat protein
MIDKGIVDKGITINNRRGAKQNIYSAARTGAIRQVESILLQVTDKKKLINTRDEDGALPLHLAASHGQEKMVKFLLHTGADVNKFDRSGYSKKTALHWAALKNYPAIVQLLLDAGANIEAKTNNGKTALMFAAGKGYKGIVQLLLERGADVHARTHRKQTTTALTFAAAHGHEDIVRHLLERKADVDSRALTLAARNGHKGIMQLLLAHGDGANIHAKTNKGKTARTLAARGHEATTQLLLEHEAVAKNDEEEPVATAL